MNFAKARSCLFYGTSGSGKTTELARIAKLMWHKYKLRSRLICSDGGGWSAFEDYGLIDPDNPTCSETFPTQAFDITNRGEMLADVRRLGDGYWPRLTKDGDLYFATDAACMTDWKRPNVPQVYLGDSLTGMADSLLDHIMHAPNKVGFKPSWEYDEGGYHFQGLQDGHWLVIQNEIFSNIVKRFHQLPIKWDCWSALAGVGGGGEKKAWEEKKFGPSVAGQALTTKIPAWFGDSFHLEQILIQSTDGKQTQKRVAWFTEHSDPTTGLKYQAKGRMIPELTPTLLESFPNGFIELTYDKGIEQWFNTTDNLRTLFAKCGHNKAKMLEVLAKMKEEKLKGKDTKKDESDGNNSKTTTTN